MNANKSRTMKKIDKHTLVRFLADDLPEANMKNIRQLIQTDKAWADACANLQSGIQATQEFLKTHSPDVQPPPYYWNSFNPRLNDRIGEHRRHVKLFKRWSFFTAPALGLAALFLIFFRIPDDTGFQPARDWLYSVYPEDSIESMLNAQYLSADEFLNSISLSDVEAGSLDEYFNGSVNESESVYLEPVDEFQKLEASEQDEILKELSKTEFL